MKGLTWIELIAVIAIVVVFMAIIMPAMGPHHEICRKASCAANLAALGKATAIYAAQNNDSLPIASEAFSGTWMSDEPRDAVEQWAEVVMSTLMLRYDGAKRLFYCSNNNGQDQMALWNEGGTFAVTGYVLFNERSKAGGGDMPQSGAAVRRNLPLAYHDKFQATPQESRSELAADWIISDKGVDDKNARWSGFTAAGRPGVYGTSHMNKQRPRGANVLCFDGHVEWRVFDSKNAVAVQQGGGANAPYFWFPNPR